MSTQWLSKACVGLVFMSVIVSSYGQSATLTVADIEKMLAAKISETVILARVRQTGSPVLLSVDDIIKLKTLGASDTFVETVMNPAQVTGAKDGSPVAVGRPEPGVYFKKGDVWMGLEPELIKIRKSNPFKRTYKMTTGGVDTKGYLDLPSSKATLRTPIVIMLVTPDGVSAIEYQLVRLKSSNKDNTREFQVGGKSEHSKDEVALDFQKLGPRQFTGTLPSSAVAGEYAFLPPMSGGLAAAGKAYSFRIIE